MFEIPILPMPISLVTIHTDCKTTLGKAYSQVYNSKSRHIALRHSLVQGYIVKSKFNVVKFSLDLVSNKF